MARANSDVEDGPLLNSDEEPSPQAEKNGSTRSPTATVNETATQQSAGPIAHRYPIGVTAGETQIA